MQTSTLNIDIKITKQSSLHTLNKQALVFGKQFADHMLVCDYERGEWKTAQIGPVEHLSLHPATSFFHYGQAIFEGIKAYRHPDGSVVMFRPEENWKRMNQSAARLDMPQIPEELFMEGMRQLIALDKEWVPEEEGASLYIRPFMIGTDTGIGLESSGSYKFIIITSPVGAYYSKDVSIYVQDKYTRAAPGGIGFTKAAGNYAASMLPTAEVREMGHDQVLWTDAVEHKYVQEIGTMNVFFVVEGRVLTPALEDGTILAGITRDSIITLLKENGIPVEERRISIDELVGAYEAGKLQEAFGSGTAASMSMISDLTYDGKALQLPPSAGWSIAPRIRKELDDIRYGRIPDRFSWIHTVS